MILQLQIKFILIAHGQKRTIIVPPVSGASKEKKRTFSFKFRQNQISSFDFLNYYIILNNMSIVPPEIEQDTAEAEDAYKVSDLIFPPANFLYERDLVSFSVNNKLLRGTVSMHKLRFCTKDLFRLG